MAAAAQGVEALGVLFASVLAGIDASSGRSYHTSSGVALTLIGLVTAGALGWLCYGITQVRPWSRTPAIMTHLFVGLIGVLLLQGHRWAWGVPALAVAVTGLTALVWPRSLRALARQPRLAPDPPPAAGPANRPTAPNRATGPNRPTGPNRKQH